MCLGWRKAKYKFPRLHWGCPNDASSFPFPKHVSYTVVVSHNKLSPLETSHPSIFPSKSLCAYRCPPGVNVQHSQTQPWPQRRHPHPSPCPKYMPGSGSLAWRRPGQVAFAGFQRLQAAGWRLWAEAPACCVASGLIFLPGPWCPCLGNEAVILGLHEFSQ